MWNYSNFSNRPHLTLWLPEKFFVGLSNKFTKQNISFEKKGEKWLHLQVIFFQLIIMKGAILELYVSNLISSNCLRPFLANFRIFTILSSTATLTQYETSVPLPVDWPKSPAWLGLRKIRWLVLFQSPLVNVAFSILCKQWAYVRAP